MSADTVRPSSQDQKKRCEGLPVWFSQSFIPVSMIHPMVFSSRHRPVMQKVTDQIKSCSDYATLFILLFSVIIKHLVTC